MNIDEAIDSLERIRAETPRAVQTAIDEIGRRALFAVRGQTPVASGELAASWHWTGEALENTAPYASYVEDGLLDRLVPAELSKLEPVFTQIVERRLKAAGGFDG